MSGADHDPDPGAEPGPDAPEPGAGGSGADRQGPAWPLAAEAALPGAGDPELASHGAAFRSELRAEAAEWERVAALDALRRRSLADAARELLHRGDRVAVALAGRRWVGSVVHVGTDVACLGTAAGLVDVRLDGGAVWEVVQRARAGGGTGGGPRTFRARLAARERAGERIGLTCPGLGVDPAGTLVALARDHVVLRGSSGQSLLVPLAGVAVVWPSRTGGTGGTGATGAASEAPR